jgi:hypothetical protein
LKRGDVAMWCMIAKVIGAQQCSAKQMSSMNRADIIAPRHGKADN